MNPMRAGVYGRLDWNVTRSGDSSIEKLYDFAQVDWTHSLEPDMIPPGENARMANIKNHMVETAKALASLSLASIVRASLGGLEQGRQSLKDTYMAVSPLAPLKAGAGMKMIRRIPAKSLASLGAVQEQITLDLRYADVDGSTPLLDLIAILSLAKSQNPRAVLEFGTYFGSTTANLALNLPDATINTIDLPEDTETADALIEGRPVDDLHLIHGRQLGKAFRGTELASRIVQHQGDTATYDYSVIPGPVGFFLIDGSHTYEYARNDTARSLELAQGECTLLWHDCEPYCPGVLKCLVELVDLALPVVRIEGTTVACLRIDARDSRVQRFLAANGRKGA